jgi:GR25 family glycosyltransferase involved in LPS biosynthesis
MNLKNNTPLIIDEIFDHIYVLNLKESTDRKLHIQNEFKRVGISKYEFFEASPHDSEEVKNLTNSNLVKKFPNCFRCDKKRCDCENNFLTSFQLGNWCSFLNIFKDIIEKEYNFVLICEDDIVFSFQHKRIINALLSKYSFEIYNINMQMPLLIRFGTAFNPDNHNSSAEPRFLRNYSLCNPCFAINRSMAMIYLKFLKIIDYHSDVYFHQKIPKAIKGIQFFTMYPYPVYELSFVKEKQKFDSLVRPVNAIRRLEYKDFLFITGNSLLNIFANNIIKLLNLDILSKNMGYHGNLNYFILANEKDKQKYYFQNKFLIYDNYYDDIKIIYQNIITNNVSMIKIYNLYLANINKKNNLILNLVNDVKLLDNIVLFYKYYLELINKENAVKIDINNDLLCDLFIKNINETGASSILINSKILKDNINSYKNYKGVFLQKCNITNEDIDKYYI